MSDPWDKLTREQARALIAEHKIVALERRRSLRGDADQIARYGDYEADHNQYFRLGNGQMLWRQDSDDCSGEEWVLMHDVIDATAVDAPLKLGAVDG
jgi:hypothetical protein